MSWQPIFDNCANLQVEYRPQVAQTQTRSGVVRTVDRGNAFWRYVVTMPNGVPWTEEFRTVTAGYTQKDRLNSDTVNFANSGFSWMFPYRGDETNIANVRINVLSDQFTFATGVTITSGFVFLAGDLIQPVGGRVYLVTENVAWNDSVIPTHRPPVDETAGTYDLRTGGDCEHTVICTSLPNWYFVERNQVAWDGSFVFQEVLS